MSIAGQDLAPQQSRAVHVRVGSPPEVAVWALMSAPTSSGHAVALLKTG